MFSITKLSIRIELKNILTQINWLEDTVTGNSVTGDAYFERKWKNQQKDE